MRVRIIASKPKRPGEGGITSLVDKEFNVTDQYDDGVLIDNKEPVGFFIYHDEYEVVEQKEAPTT